MNKLMLTFAMSFMLLSTSAMALTINVEPKKEEKPRVVPPPPPPPPPPAPVIICKYSEPKCDRHDRIHAERYENDQKMYSRGECYRGDKERNFDFYCNNGDVWMKVDFRRDRADRIECYDPRTKKFFASRTIGECEDLHRDLNRPHPQRRHHHPRDDRR